jgi:bifunctional UDP-N-acetylglucosamine pyrophosphorylase/glucosamine-1-phosphate N-acetyltransferase
MNVVILAAGLGKRMNSDLPKVLHPVAGRPMLTHVVETARTFSGADPIVIVVGHGGDLVRQTLEKTALEEADPAAPGLHWVVQEPQLGTGHAVALAIEQLDSAGSTLVLYGDVPLVQAATLRRLVAAAGEGVAVLTQPMADPTGYGRIVRNDRGFVRAIVEHADANATELAIHEVNTGILVAPNGALKTWLAGLSRRNAQGEYYLTDVIAAAIASGVAVGAVEVTEPDEALGVNSRAQLAQVERVAQLRIARRLMDDGATLADPARIDVRGKLSVGRDVTIDVGCVFEGEVELADRVRIGPYCVLRDVRVAADTEIIAFAHFERARIGSGARLGPFARLRPGADIGDQVHIGNFVEVKASRLDTGAKANHLAYIGDATVGARTNVGAGTIVANYDGVNKHRTEIGANVLIGSNAVLVAPVRIGDGATVGAGSTISREAPADRLTLARARQVTIATWQRPTKKK